MATVTVHVQANLSFGLNSSSLKENLRDLITHSWKVSQYIWLKNYVPITCAQKLFSFSLSALHGGDSTGTRAMVKRWGCNREEAKWYQEKWKKKKRLLSAAIKGHSRKTTHSSSTPSVFRPHRPGANTRSHTPSAIIQRKISYSVEHFRRFRTVKTSPLVFLPLFPSCIAWAQCMMGYIAGLATVGCSKTFSFIIFSTKITQTAQTTVHWTKQGVISETKDITREWKISKGTARCHTHARTHQPLPATVWFLALRQPGTRERTGECPLRSPRPLQPISQSTTGLNYS